MASRIKLTILDHIIMAIDSVLFLWSDSKIVLNYLQNAKTNFGLFMLQRCSKIQVNMKKIGRLEIHLH